MAMFKDVNNLIQEIIQALNTLQNIYRKYGLNHKLSNTKNRFRNGNEKANLKFHSFYTKLHDWIKQEMEK